MDGSPPVDVDRIAVLLVARDLAGAAADAFRHVEVEAVLLAGLEGAVRDKACNNGSWFKRLAKVAQCHAHDGVCFRG